MKRLTLALIATLELAAVFITGCASVPKPHAQDPNRTPLAVVGIFECGKMKGILVVTKAGEIVAVDGEALDDLKALQEKLPDSSAGNLDLTDNCPPTQTTSL